MSEFDPGAIRALAFDVFGTVVDWRGSIVRELDAPAATRVERDELLMVPAHPSGLRA